ncbi:MAG: type II toxin-antitoxin system HicA family toxin [Nitrososphaeria archaeon]
MIKALTKIGFRPVRQKGSHVILKHNDETIRYILSEYLSKS